MGSELSGSGFTVSLKLVGGLTYKNVCIYIYMHIYIYGRDLPYMHSKNEIHDIQAFSLLERIPRVSMYDIGLQV